MSEAADAVEMARTCLATGEAVAVLQIHQFEDDSEAHDEDKQNGLSAAFESAFSVALGSLVSSFGAAVIGENEDDFDFVPIGGVFLSASWVIGDQRLYLAAAHEDRETPFILAVGVV